MSVRSVACGKVPCSRHQYISVARRLPRTVSEEKLARGLELIAKASPLVEDPESISVAYLPCLLVPISLVAILPHSATYPIFRLHTPEEVLLLMQIRRHIVAKKRKETRNRKSLVAIPQDLEVHRVAIVQIAQEADGRVDWDQEQDPDDVFLLGRFEVVGGMLPDQYKSYDETDEAKDCAEDEA